jgi:hypothetical protein
MNHTLPKPLGTWGMGRAGGGGLVPVQAETVRSDLFEVGLAQ